MKNIGKKFLASILAIAQVITFTPVNNMTAYAADGGSGNEEARDGNKNSLFKSTLDSDGNLTVTITEKIGSTKLTKDIAEALWGKVKDKIKTVTFDNAITNIEGMNDCVNLTSIHFPSNLACVSHDGGSGNGQNAFAGCTSLTEVDMSNCTKLEHLPYGYFSKCTNLSTVTLPEGIECISHYCFADCTSLTTINIPDSCKNIIANAFENDTSLKSIDLNKVELIGSGAFNSTGLTEIYFPDTVQSVDNAFNECYHLQKISGGNGLANYLGKSNGGISTSADKNNNTVIKADDIFAVNNMQAPNNSSYDGVYNVNHYHKSLETNVDDAADCIKNANWYKAGRYLYTLNFIDATHQVFDTDKTFAEYTAYFDNYTKEMAAVETSTTGADRVAVKPLQAKENATEITTANLQEGIRSLDYKPQTKDGKIYTPSDKWKVSTDENGEVVDITENTTIDTIIQKAGMNNHVINLYLTEWTKKDVPKKQYTVNFYKIKGNDTVTQTYNENDNLKDIPTDLDYSNNDAIYTFKGWSTSRQESDITTVDESIKVTKNLNYYAIYERKSKVALKYVYTTMSDSNEPVCGDSWNLSTDTTKYLKDTRAFESYIGAKLGDTYEKAPETLKNLSFYNWYIYDKNNSSYTEIEINADTEVTYDNTVDGDKKYLVLYAIYGPKKYNVSFINEDDTSENKSGQVKAGKTYGDTFTYDQGYFDNVISSYWTPTPKSDDKVFKGWKVNDTTEIVSTENALKRVINEDTTFKAVFEIPKYTAKFYYITDGDDYNDTPIVKNNIDAGTKLKDVKPDSIPERQSDDYIYTFKGWSDSRYDDYTLDDSTIDSDVEFFAKYDKKDKTYHVIFKDEDGTTIDEEDVPKYTPLGDITPNDPSKEGKDFKGWDDGTGIKSDDTPIIKDTTFTAKYEPKPTEKVTVRFVDWNDTELGEKVVDKGTLFGAVNKPNPTREGYTFTKWTYIYALEIITATDDFVINYDITFTANYDAAYTVYFNYSTDGENYDNCITKEDIAKGAHLKDIKPDNDEILECENDDYKYTFIGWARENDDIDSTDTIEDDIIDKDEISYYAKYSKTPIVKYTVTFKPENGEADTVEPNIKSGTHLYRLTPDNPTKEGYTFKGWSKDGTTVIDEDDEVITQDTTYIAIYEKDPVVPANIKIIFVEDDENTVLLNENVYALGISFKDLTKPTNPTKASDENYTYQFKGWRVKGETDLVDTNRTFNTDTTLVAVYDKTPVIKMVKVNFVDEDSTPVCDEKTVVKNSTLGEVTDKPVPTKADDDNFTYVFDGWTVDDNKVDDTYKIEKDTTFKATYRAEQKPIEPVTPNPDAKVTVIFDDYDLTEITRNTDVVSGSALSTVKPAEPSRTEDENYTYTFAGWKLEENNAVVTDDYKILKDTTFIATYTATKKDKTYHVIFKDEDGTIIDEKDVPENTPLGDIKPNNPSKEGKDFKGWDDGTGIKPDDTPITKDTTFTAKYEPKAAEKVTVKFVDWNNTELDKMTVDKGTLFGALNEPNPTREGYTFTEWTTFIYGIGPGFRITATDDFVINYDITFTANYNKNEKPKPAEKVTVTFKDYDGTTIKEKEVEKNSLLGTVKPENPTRTDYNFVGWSKDDVVRDDEYVITEDTTFIATYVTKETKLIQIDGTLLDKDGKPIANAVVTLHSTVRQTKTDENGYYIFKNVELEEHKINAKVDNTEVYKYNIDATDVENIKKVLEAQDKNYDVNSNISEKNGIVTITLNAKEKGNETPTPNPTPNPTPVKPTPVEPTPVEPTPVNPTPVVPTPVNPTPVEPTPVEPEPTPEVPEVPEEDKPEVPDTPINVEIKVNPSAPTPDEEDEETPKKHHKEEESIPKTGDNVFVYVIGLVAGILVLKKKKRK